MSVAAGVVADAAGIGVSASTGRDVAAADGRARAGALATTTATATRGSRALDVAGSAREVASRAVNGGGAGRLGLIARR